jgi:hypothetical protein
MRIEFKTRKELLSYFEALSDQQLRRVITLEGAHVKYMEHQIALINKKYPLKT